MSTTFHTPIATGAAANAATFNSVFEQLDAAIAAGLGGITLTNKSGGTLAANDCVIVDITNAEAVTTTTTLGSTTRPGIVLVGGAANAEVTVSLLGEVTVVVSATASKGQWFKTSTVAKRVSPTATLDVGVFGVFTTDSSGGAGTTAKGLLLGYVITTPGTHTHAAADIISGLLALARGGSGADLSATGPGYAKQLSLGAALSIGAILAADLPAASEAAQGAVELASSAETLAGTDTARAIHPAAAAAAYWLRSLYINTSAGAGDAGKPIVLDAAGKIAASMIAPSTIDHNQLLNLAVADPHTQYLLRALLTTKGDIIVRDASGPQRLAAGATGQVLAVDPAEPTGLKYVPQVSGGSGIPGSTITAKGDLIVGTAAATYTALAAGAVGQVVMADPSQATGLVWANLLQNNIFINGGPDTWQRTTDDTGVTTTRKYVAEMWAVKTGAGTLAHVQRSTTVRSGARSKYSMQLDGAASITTVDVDQRIEAAMAGAYKRQVYFSAYVFNATGAAFTPKLFVSTPAAADDWTTPTVRNGGGSGEDLQSCADSTWQQVTWTADISGYTNIDNGLEFRLQIPSGVLVASKTVRLAELNLVSGGVATPFVARQPADENNLIQRHIYYTPDTISTIRLGVRSGTTTIVAYFIFPVTMRVVPTTFSHNISGWTNGAPGTTTLGAFNYSTGAFVTITGALTVASLTLSRESARLDLTAGTSFNGTAGDFVELYLGASVRMSWGALL